MKIPFFCGVLAICCSAALPSPSSGSKVYQLTPVNFSKVKIQDQFWMPRIRMHAQHTLPVCIEQTEVKTGRLRNFEKAAMRAGKHEGIYYDDSDVYKVLEGMAYALSNDRNPALEQKADDWINKIAAAQLLDGYLNTYFTLTGLDKRWTDMEKHEDYCSGHLIEAAVAYYNATGKRKLLEVAIRLANHIDSTLRLANRHWVTGHEELELALVKLYHITHNKQYLLLANWLLEQRGHGYGRGAIWDNKKWGPVYCQDDKPVKEMTDIGGHAVRAMYLYTSMADVAAATHDTSYLPALYRLWEDVVNRNMYITGGIGSSGSNEGFTQDYDLPNDQAYCETCASVGMVFWNQRMNLLTGDAKYIDVLEQSLYNSALDGVSLKGDRFFYVNPLQSDGNHHRKEWYGTACCPSNISRLLPSLGDYIYNTSPEGLWVNLYIGNTAVVNLQHQEVQVTQKTQYPWNGAVTIKVKPVRPIVFDARLRIPSWCKSYRVRINNRAIIAGMPEKGYLKIHRRWKAGDVISLQLDMPVQLVSADPRVKADTGKRAIRRGPLIYCLEEADNKGIAFDKATLTQTCSFQTRFEPQLLDGITVISTRANGQRLTFIPYYAWDNREPGRMKVWLEYK